VLEKAVVSKKPIVHYYPHGDTRISLGYGATVLPADHPSERVPNTTWAETSPVIYIHPTDGSFETRNTLYRSFKE
jgi:hypothetical protein